MTTANTKWTKDLVQSHARAAVAVELYTLPLYLTALTSINMSDSPSDTTKSIHKAIASVCLEEMLHLQLAANLCIALDTVPNFIAPQYGVNIPYLKPDDPVTGDKNALLKATLRPLDETMLNAMLDIETPTFLETQSDESQDPTTPKPPYNLAVGERC